MLFKLNDKPGDIIQIKFPDTVAVISIHVEKHVQIIEQSEILNDLRKVKNAIKGVLLPHGAMDTALYPMAGNDITSLLVLFPNAKKFTYKNCRHLRWS
jgi:hypothetical protein